ncbi:MAG: DUF2130 domain-containing protein [Pseudomonadota bacterium]
MADRIEPTITCPNCAHEIELSEQLAGPLLADLKRSHAAELAAQREALAGEAREAARAEQAALMAKREAEQEAKLREAAEALAAQKARADVADERLTKAREAEKAALAKEAALLEREAELELAAQKQVALERRAQEERIRAQLTAQLAESQQARDEERDLALKAKDEQMETLKRQIELLKQKSEKGSQQLQGEALEVALEERLALAFPFDQITPVGKGVRGADCLQSVAGAGAIIWEAKRTQNWSKDWPVKLKEDQRREGAEAAVLVSTVLPDGVETFAEHEGVWATLPRYAVALSSVLRQGLIATAQAERRKEGQAEKTELLYDYLTGTGFRQRVEALAETYDAMRKTLDQERRAMMKHWAARDQQMLRMMDATAGMYGDIQGIAGASLPGIDALELAPPEDD